MKWIKGIVGIIWKIYVFLVVLFSLLLLYPIYLVVLLNDKYLDIGFHFTRFQARLILFFIGVRWKKHGQIPRDKEVSYIICPNHSSYLDILILYAVFPNYFIFLGKQELGKVPLFNIFFKKLNILINRTNPISAHQSILKAVERMKSGINVVIFPEGTIPRTVPQMKPFKNGAFKVAIEEEIPIVPVTFKGNHELLEDAWGFFANSRPGLSEIFIHEPIQVNKQDDLITLREKTKDVIASKL